MVEILIVDDEAAIREGIAVLLASEGYAIRQAANGAEAIDVCRVRLPDLVLLDVMMPVMDGYAACAALREVDAELPIVFLTAKDSDDDQARGFELGADDYLSKTTSAQMILVRVKASLARTARFRGSRAEAPSFMTKTEADIYRVLASQKGRFFSYREIFSAIRGEGYFADEGAIRSHISRLRGKLPPDETVEARRGRGFALQIATILQP